MRADAARNNTRILEAARELVRSRGADVSMDEIAGAAGVAVGTLYRHHPTKAALLEAVIADSLEDWAEHAEASSQQVRDGGDPRVALGQLIRTIAVDYSADRTVKATAAALGAQVVGTTGPYPPGSVELRVLAAVETVLSAALQAGAVRPDFTTADLALVTSGVPDGAEAAHRYIDLVLHGVLTSPAAAS